MTEPGAGGSRDDPDRWIQQHAVDIVRSILRESTDTFFVKDTDLRMVLCSPGLARSINRSPNDVYGKRDIEAGWGPDFVQGNPEKGIRGWEQDDRAALSGVPVRVHDEPRTAPGGVLVGDVVKIPLRNENGEVIGIVGIGRDMTEREAARQEMVSIVNSSEDAIISKSLDGTIRSWNPAAERMYGYPAREALGRNVSFMVPQDRQDDLPFFIRQVADGGHVNHYETERVRADGTRIFVSISISPIRDAAGRITGACTIARDISERRRAEERLRESEARWRTVVSASPDGILVLSREGTIEQVSSKVLALCGYGSEAEMIGLPVFQLIDPEDRQKARAMLEMKVSGARTRTSEYLALRKDGQRFPVEVNAEVLQGSQGSTARLVLVVRDVTEHKRLEEQFRQAQKMEAVGRLAGGVAHDFNNMLGVILGHAELAGEQAGDDEPLRQHFDEIRKAAERSAGLTRKLLAFARKQAVVPRVLDINETVTSMMNMLQRLIGEDIELVLELAPGLWSVRVDPSQVDQVLANLAVNARDAITGPGRLVISTENVETGSNGVSSADELPHGDYILLSVRDSGAGMNGQTMGHLFEPFFTTKEPGKGTGLGLATAYGAVKQNGGFIRVSSALGKGTTFRIYLPRVDAAASASESVPRGSSRGTGTILFVEDEESILFLGRDVLQRSGYTVLTARSSIEALALAQAYPGKIDLLITDLVMPGMNGKQLSETLAELRPETKSLFISGYTAEVISHDGIVEEGIEYLQKPFSVHVLTERVRAALSPDHHDSHCQTPKR